jgi:predicted ABC-type ATPase
VAAGGHDVPETKVRQRHRGLAGSRIGPKFSGGDVIVAGVDTAAAEIALAELIWRLHAERLC